MTKKDGGDLKFEKGLEDLEKIVESLEGGDMDLEAALKNFEKGVKLTKDLQKKLEESQRKVKTLLKGENGPEEGELGNDGDAPSKSKKGPQDSLF